MPFTRLRGTHDLIGSKALVWERIERIASEVFSRYAYLPIRTPIIEPAKLFTRSVGEASDIVQKEMYHFLDRSQDEIALRPEGTASIVRAYLENNLNQEKPCWKLYYMGPMFRAERPQAGRQRQFHQIGAEVFGFQSPLADAETILTLSDFLARAGVKEFRIEINNLGTSEDRIHFSHLLKNFVSDKLNSLCKDCQNRFQKNVFRVLDCKNENCAGILSDAPKISDHVSVESKANFEQVCKYLRKFKIKWRHNPRIVRGLDYYTHTVFEVRHSGLGAQDALAAGGRYDGLMQMLDGPRTPAVGFAIGTERLMMAIEAERPKGSEAEELAMRVSNIAFPELSGVAIVPMGEAALAVCLQMAEKFRKAKIKCYMDLDQRSVKSQMKQADRERVFLSIIIGDLELHSKTAAVKDMRDFDSQTNVGFSKVVSHYKTLFRKYEKERKKNAQNSYKRRTD